MVESLIPAEAKAMIGKETGSQTIEISLREAQRYAAAVNDLNPIYWDEAAARAAGYKGIVVPPLALNQIIQGITRLDAVRHDGIPLRGGGDIPLRAERRMAGGEDIEFYEPVYPGDRITATSRIEDIEEKEGRSGAFVVVTRETVYTNQDGTIVARARGSMIAR